MKIKTLAWSQITISILLFLGVLVKLFNSEITARQLGYITGSNLNILLLGLFALLTGLYNLKQKK